LLPFSGGPTSAYVPAGRIVGLSKLPRIVDVFRATGCKMQERLTEEIAARDRRTCLQPRGVGVVIEAAHLCMMMRGVEKQSSKTITERAARDLPEDPRTREEFLSAGEREVGGPG